MKVRDILFEAGAKSPLIRDYDSPHDAILGEDADIDLAEGNVFRTELQGTPGDGTPCDAPPKLAFVVDDAWEVTIRPDQTGRVLRDLFEIPAEAELLRDYQSPHDATIDDDDQVLFADGPVFRTSVGSITVMVNNRPVTMPKRRDTVLELKRTAIAQEVPIALDFLVFQVKPDGSLSPPLPDDKMLTFRKGEEFRCVAPDDNS
jgi:hypothetical protein